MCTPHPRTGVAEWRPCAVPVRLHTTVAIIMATSSRAAKRELYLFFLCSIFFSAAAVTSPCCCEHDKQQQGAGQLTCNLCSMWNDTYSRVWWCCFVPLRRASFYFVADSTPSSCQPATTSQADSTRVASLVVAAAPSTPSHHPPSHLHHGVLWSDGAGAAERVHGGVPARLHRGAV